MKIEKSFDSFKQLWDFLEPAVRSKKNAQYHICGDIYEPISEQIEDEWDPINYYPPVKGHKHFKPCQWHKDINYKYRGNKRAKLLVGDKNFGFLWSTPIICMKAPFSSPMNLRKRESIQDLLLELVSADNCRARG